MKKIALSNNKRKKKLVAEILASLLLIFFVHSFISTYIQLQGLKNMLAFYTSNRDILAWSILFVELAVILTLFVPRVRSIGFVASAIFAATAIIVIILTPHYPHDFGGIINYISNKQKLMLYGLIILISLLGGIESLLFRRKEIEPSTEPIIFT